MIAFSGKKIGGMSHGIGGGRRQQSDRSGFVGMLRIPTAKFALTGERNLAAPSEIPFGSEISLREAVGEFNFAESQRLSISLSRDCAIISLLRRSNFAHPVHPANSRFACITIKYFFIFSPSYGCRP